MTAKLCAILLTPLVIFFMIKSSAPLKEMGGRLVSIEVTTSVEKANSILAEWKRRRPQDWQRLVLESLKWDTGLILSYAPWLALLCWLAAGHFRALNATTAGFGYALAGAQLFAGACDFIENAGLRHTVVAGEATRPWVQITGVAAIIKWLLIAAGSAFSLVALFVR